MEERSATQWARSWEAAPASMFRHGLGDTGLIGTSMHPNPAIQHGVTQPFWICTAAGLRPGLGALIRITAGPTEQFTCSRRQILTRSLRPCSKALNRWASNDSRILMEE